MLIIFLLLTALIHSRFGFSILKAILTSGVIFYLKQILKKRQKKSTSCYNEGGKFLIFGDSYAIAVAGVFFCCHGV